MNIWFNCISLQLFIFVCSGIHLSMMQVCQLDSIDNKHWRLSADQAKLHQCSLIHRKRDRKRTNVDQTCSQCVAGQRRPWTVGDTQRVVYVCVNGKRFFAKTCWPLTLWPIRWWGGSDTPHPLSTTCCVEAKTARLTPNYLLISFARCSSTNTFK